MSLKSQEEPAGHRSQPLARVTTGPTRSLAWFQSASRCKYLHGSSQRLISMDTKRGQNSSWILNQNNNNNEQWLLYSIPPPLAVAPCLRLVRRQRSGIEALAVVHTILTVCSYILAQFRRRGHRSDRPAQWTGRGKPGEGEDSPLPLLTPSLRPLKHHLLSSQRKHSYTQVVRTLIHKDPAHSWH